MARTYEALCRAAKENLIVSDDIGVFDKEVQARPSLAATTLVPKECVEEFHHMKQTIASLAIDREIKTLLFCCSSGGEGTTTVLINFARTIAAEGDRVLVVDANLRNPSIHDALNLEQKTGFTDLLLGRAAVAEAVKKSSTANLSAITCGTRSSNPFALLESSRLSLIIEQLKPLADWVLFDTPPVISCNDACVLAPKVDGVIMVLEAEKTRREVLNSARQRMENNSSKILGAVLNKRQMHIPDWAYNIL
jgi:capsular exopolysaccharide synthesis family protein